MGTVTFAGAKPVTAGKSGVKGCFQDVNGDGIVDVVLHFKTQDLDLQPGDTVGTVSGFTLSGQMFVGTDSVRIVK